MKLKNISRLLSVGVLLNSFNLASYASILSEDGRYETFLGSNITIDDVLEEDKSDVKIEGNTINNIVLDNQSAIIKGNTKDYYEQYIQKTIKLNYPLKANTEYTISLNVKSNGYNHPPFHSIVIGQGDVDSGMGLDTWSFRLYWNKDFNFDKNSPNLGVYKVKFITPSRVEETSFDHIRFVAHNWDSFDSVIEEISIFEGDLISNYPNKYFSGLQSSFENQLITQEMVDSGQEKAENLGKYKVEVKSTGKNLFNPIVREENNTSVTNGGCTISYNDNIFTVTGNSGNDGTKETYNNLWYLRQQLKPNTKYTMSYSSDGVFGGAYGEDTVEVYLYNIDKKDNYIYDSISPTRVKPEGTSFTTGDTGIITCRFDLNKNDTRHLFYNIQIEESSTVTEYEPYKESINTFYLNSPLLEGDTIECINGQPTHIKRYKKIVLDGSESWSDWNTEVNVETVRFKIDTYDGRPNGIALSDKFITRKAPSEKHSDTEYIGLIGSGSNLFINILSSKLQSADIDGFKQWLSKNHVTVVYELEEPIYEPIKADLSVKLFEGITHISNNSAIPVNIEITVDRVLNRAVEAIELVKINPTVANISLARMWINLAKESVKKDELQNKIDIITDIEDLQIEKKSVTSNMDIYIKPLNSLSMSLSTNQIIFEDYSSVNDLDMNNALQISINSSLPYQLNSYLETEIQNSDGSNVINKDLLHIKDNTDSDYKQFLGINQKLILKEDCEAGSNNIHNIDLKLKASAHDADIYKATIKFEAEQK